MNRLRKWGGRFLLRIVRVGSWILIIGSLISFLFPSLYFSELFCHFRLQHSVLLFIALLILLKHKNWIFKGLLLLAFIANVSPILPYWGFSSSAKNEEGFRVCSINVLSYSHTYEKVIGYIQEENPEVVVLIEVNARWKKALEPLRVTYPYQVDASAEGNYGMMLISKKPFSSSRIEYTSFMRTPMIVATLTDGLTVAGVHFRSPDLYEKFLARNQTYRTIARRKEFYPENTIFIGDFNTTTYSIHLRRFIRDMKLRDSRIGRGLFSSWPSVFPPLWVPIDHALVSDKLQVIRREKGPHIGSDHFPILLEVRHPDF